MFIELTTIGTPANKSKSQEQRFFKSHIRSVMNVATISRITPYSTKEQANTALDGDCTCIRFTTGENHFLVKETYEEILGMIPVQRIAKI